MRRVRRGEPVPEGGAVVNIDDLRKIAEEATPGPWITGGELPGSDGVFFGTAVDPDDPDEPGILLGEAYAPDAEFIATFNPETVLALLDRVETAEQALQRVRAIAEAYDQQPEERELCGAVAQGIRAALEGDE